MQQAVEALQGLQGPGEASSALWVPRQGDAVLLLSMGRSAGQVLCKTLSMFARMMSESFSCPS